MAVVVKACAYILVNVPDFVRYGSKPIRDLEGKPELLHEINSRLRTYDEVLAYAPNQVFIGNRHPDDLHEVPSPWYDHPLDKPSRDGPFGEIMPQEEFYGWIKIADDFDLVWLAKGFIDQIRDRIASHALIRPEDIQKLGTGVPPEKIQKLLAENGALPLYFHGSVVGLLRHVHENDDCLKAHVLMENILAKASGALVVRHLLQKAGMGPGDVDFLLECSETAIGDRYQRGGGSLAKAIAEMCRCPNATGHDIRAFCAAPIYAIINAAGLVQAGIYRNVVVVGGGCLAKIGMKYAAHLKSEMPVLEDVLGGVAFLVTTDDGINPIIRLDCIGKHDVIAGSSQQAIMTTLVSRPLAKLGMKMLDVDKYATEMHNAEITLPAGSGNTPYTNYKIMASLAALNKEIDRTEIEKFIRVKGMPGFSPTQGHVPAAVPFLGHARQAMNAGNMKFAMFLAKGSPFLGRMSELSDGVSFLLERNPVKN